MLADNNNPCYNSNTAVTQINITKEKLMFNTETKTFKLFIRQAGYAVYANKRVAGNGVAVTEYVIGKPSRKIVAAGYKALAMGLV